MGKAGHLRSCSGEGLSHWAHCSHHANQQQDSLWQGFTRGAPHAEQPTACPTPAGLAQSYT